MTPTHRNGVFLALLALAGLATAATAGPPAPTMTLGADPSGFSAGETVEVTVTLTNLAGGTPVAGWQAFLEFDDNQLDYDSTNYPAAPFGLHILTDGANTIESGDELNLAAGINQTIGQLPTTADTLLATISFTALADGCTPVIDFRDNKPPTRITDVGGADILPLNLVGVDDCLGDTNGDNTVNVTDLVNVITLWGSDDCAADVDGMCNETGCVNVLDLVAVITNWGPCQ